MLCGIGIIIPGFSFSSLALLINVYNDLLLAINNFFKTPKKSLKILLPFFLGAITSSVLLFFPINLLLKNYPLVLLMFFSGLLIGGFSSLMKKIKKQDFLFVILGFIFFFLLSNLINVKTEQNLNSFSLSLIFIIFFASLLSAFAALAPSLSITFILMNFGLYTPLMNIVENVLKFNFSNVWQINIILNLLSLVIFFIAFVFIFAHFISKILQKEESKTISFFLGSAYATLINVYLNSLININPINKNLNLWYYYAISVVFLLLGLLIILLLTKRKT